MEAGHQGDQRHQAEQPPTGVREYGDGDQSEGEHPRPGEHPAIPAVGGTGGAPLGLAPGVLDLVAGVGQLVAGAVEGLDPLRPDVVSSHPQPLLRRADPSQHSVSRGQRGRRRLEGDLVGDRVILGATDAGHHRDRGGRDGPRERIAVEWCEPESAAFLADQEHEVGIGGGGRYSCREVLGSGTPGRRDRHHPRPHGVPRTAEPLHHPTYRRRAGTAHHGHPDGRRPRREHPLSLGQPFGRDSVADRLLVRRQTGAGGGRVQRGDHEVQPMLGEVVPQQSAGAQQPALADQVRHVGVVHPVEHRADFRQHLTRDDGGQPQAAGALACGPQVEVQPTVGTVPDRGHFAGNPDPVREPHPELVLDQPRDVRYRSGVATAQVTAASAVCATRRDRAVEIGHRRGRRRLVVLSGSRRLRSTHAGECRAGGPSPASIRAAGTPGRVGCSRSTTARQTGVVPVNPPASVVLPAGARCHHPEHPSIRVSRHSDAPAVGPPGVGHRTGTRRPAPRVRHPPRRRH